MKFCSLNNIFTRLLLVLVAAFCLAGCRRHPAHIPGSVGAKSINVRPYAVETKGSVTTTSALENQGRFVMEAYVDDSYCNYLVDPEGENVYPSGVYIERVPAGNVIYGSGVWNITPQKNWVSDVNTTFWCWAPVNLKPIPAGISVAQTTRDVNTYQAPYTSEQLRFDYARPGIASFPLLNPDGTLNANSSKFVDADIQDDLLFAYARQSFDEKLGNDAVTLRFYHPLSQIRFAVSPDDGSFDATLRIVQIAIKNIKQGGQCVFRGNQSDYDSKFSWDVNSSPLTSYCQTYDAGFTSVPEGWTDGTYVKESTTYRFYTCENVFFVTPQNLASLSPGATIDILFEDRGTYIEVERPLEPDNWKPGYYYTYKINATVLGRTIKVGVSLADWQNYDDKLFI